MKNRISIIYNLVRTKYWNDPVWSKVISNGIIILIGSIGTAIFLLSKSVISNITFTQSFNSLIASLKAKSEINNFLLLIVSIYLLSTFLLTLKKYLDKVAALKKLNLLEKVPVELPSVPNIATAFFADRLASAFPGQRGIVWFNDPKIIVERLMIFFKSPIKFATPTVEGYTSDPLWWFRETSSMYINRVEKLSKTKLLIDVKELEIKRMAINVDQSYFKCYIYIETKGEKQTNLSTRSNEEIQNSIGLFGYCWEEFGQLKNKKITRQELDDGAALINGKVVEAFDADPRMRFLSDYNFIIAANNSPYNSRKFEIGSKKYFNGILKNEVKAEELFEYLDTFQKYEG